MEVNSDLKSLDAYNYITIVATKLRMQRDPEQGIDLTHSRWLEEALTIWRSFEHEDRDVDSMPMLPRYSGTTSVSDFYRTNVSIPLLDRFIAEFDARFGELQRTAALGMYILPKYCLPMLPTQQVSQTAIENRIQNILLACRSFTELFTNPEDAHEFGIYFTSEAAFRSELATWDTFWAQRKLTEDVALIDLKSLLAKCDIFWQPGFPIIERLVHLLASLPVTTCSVERSISQLGLVKTQHRSTMSQERFTDLCMLKCFPDFCFDHAQVIKSFAIGNIERMSNLIF